MYGNSLTLRFEFGTFTRVTKFSILAACTKTKSSTKLSSKGDYPCSNKAFICHAIEVCNIVIFDTYVGIEWAVLNLRWSLFVIINIFL